VSQRCLDSRQVSAQHDCELSVLTQAALLGPAQPGHQRRTIPLPHQPPEILGQALASLDLVFLKKLVSIGLLLRTQVIDRPQQ
jgi:hypothetical protein